MMTIASALSVGETYAALDAGRFTAQQRAHGSEDALEGPRAYMEKRDPVWKGR